MIVLTGGAGFIGSCFLRKLNDNKFTNIIVVDRLGMGEKWKNLVGKRIYGFIDKDVFRESIKTNKSFETLFQWRKQVSVPSGKNESLNTIIHLGACTDTTEEDADYVVDNNFNYSRELGQYCAEHNIRFIYASSGATYGKGDVGYSDREFYNLKPLNIYGLSKQFFDEWVIANKLDEKFCGLKFFNVYGPNEYHKGEMTSVAYKAFRQIEVTGKVHLFKSYNPDYRDGEQKRDFIFVKDVVEVMWKIFQDDSYSGIYNLGTGKARSWNELIECVFNAIKIEPVIEYIDMPEKLMEQYQYYTCADMTKFEKVWQNKFGTKFQFTELEDGVNEYVNDYLMKEWKYM
jgi:ADP-L-glycero-D-manno-heptose 6-epimerase